MYYIYQIYCEGNGKTYIGQAANIYKRWSRHRRDLYNNKHANQYLQNAYNKYGAESFKYEMINTLETREETNDMELYWINCFRAIDQSMNLSGNTTIYSKSPESIEKQRRSLLGRKNGPHSKEWSENISRAKKAQGIKSVWLSERNVMNREKFSGVTFIHDTRGEITVDDSTMKQFCEDNNLQYCHMQAVRKGNRKSHKGWKLRT